LYVGNGYSADNEFYAVQFWVVCLERMFLFIAGKCAEQNRHKSNSSQHFWRLLPFYHERKTSRYIEDKV